MRSIRNDRHIMVGLHFLYNAFYIPITDRKILVLLQVVTAVSLGNIEY